jgi:hypothetical protein
MIIPFLFYSAAAFATGWQISQQILMVRGSEEQKAEHALTGVVLPAQAQDLRLRFRYPKVPEALRQTYA